MSKKQRRTLVRLIIGAAAFAAALLIPLGGVFRLALFLVPYFVIGGDVLLRALRNIAHGQVFDENFLMAVATVGAFCVGEYPEGVAVMLFYQVGELFQSYAVGRSRQSISALMDIRPDYANVRREGELVRVDPEEVSVDDLIVVKPGERVPLDGVIAEGTESGGHVGEMTTMALVPQVVDAVHVPVIAAGGIADGRGLAAALALGACGVQVGTCLLASIECPIHENYKEALLKARDSDTIVTGRISGTPVRVLKNRMSREYVRQEKAGTDKMELERFTLGSLRKAVFDGDTENGSLMAGQAAGLLHEVRPVEEIFAAMVSDAKNCIDGLHKEITL